MFVWWCEVIVAASMDDQQRGMMHPTSQAGMLMPQHYGMGGSVDQGQGTTTPDSEGRKQDINTILEQIMNITDQSLDEAQARWAPHACYFGRRWWRRQGGRPLHHHCRCSLRSRSHVMLPNTTHANIFHLRWIGPPKDCLGIGESGPAAATPHTPTSA